MHRHSPVPSSGEEGCAPGKSWPRGQSRGPIASVMSPLQQQHDGQVGRGMLSGQPVRGTHGGGNLRSLPPRASGGRSADSAHQPQGSTSVSAAGAPNPKGQCSPANKPALRKSTTSPQSRETKANGRNQIRSFYSALSFYQNTTTNINIKSLENTQICKVPLPEWGQALCSFKADGPSYAH